jgi:membrane AbrB-like protein
MGPLIVSLALNLIFDMILRLPDILMIIGQYLIGWSIAARFIGVTRDEVVRTLRQVFVSLLSMVPIWFGVAFALDAWTEVDLQSLILGFAPGGQAEVALLAIAMDANMAVVMLLHVFRVFLIITFGSMLFVVIRNRLRRALPD